MVNMVSGFVSLYFRASVSKHHTILLITILLIKGEAVSLTENS